MGRGVSTFNPLYSKDLRRGLNKAKQERKEEGLPESDQFSLEWQRSGDYYMRKAAQGLLDKRFDTLEDVLETAKNAALKIPEISPEGYGKASNYITDLLEGDAVRELAAHFHELSKSSQQKLIINRIRYFGEAEELCPYCSGSGKHVPHEVTGPKCGDCEGSGRRGLGTRA